MVKKIIIDNETRQILAGLFRNISESQAQINVICQTYLNAKGVTRGDYALSPDGKTLVKQVKK